MAGAQSRPSPNGQNQTHTKKEYKKMTHHEKRRAWVFYTYDTSKDKTTLTDGTTTESYTGKNLTLCLSLFRRTAGIFNTPVDLIRY